MTVKELINELLDMPMYANVELEIRSEPNYTWSWSSEKNVDSVMKISDKQVLIKLKGDKKWINF